MPRSSLKVHPNRIYDLRMERGWSQGQLAMHIDATREQVKHWETKAPTIDGLVKVAKAFDVSTDYVLGLVDERHNRGFRGRLHG